MVPSGLKMYYREKLSSHFYNLKLYLFFVNNFPVCISLFTLSKIENILLVEGNKKDSALLRSIPVVNAKFGVPKGVKKVLFSLLPSKVLHSLSSNSNSEQHISMKTRIWQCLKNKLSWAIITEPLEWWLENLYEQKKPLWNSEIRTFDYKASENSFWYLWLSVIHNGFIFQKKKSWEILKMCKNPEKWGSCFQQALSVRPTVPHVLHVPEHVRSACPHSFGEYWD